MHWIDVGCGNGAFTEVLIARFAPAAVSAIDPSDGQLDLRARGRARSLRPFALATRSLCRSPTTVSMRPRWLRSSPFLCDPQKAAREMARVVKPGGMVATYMWDIPGGGLPIKPLSAAMKSLGAEVRRGRTVKSDDARVCRRFGNGENAIDRDHGHPHSCRLFRVRRFLGVNSLTIDPSGKSLRRCQPTTREVESAPARKTADRCDGSITYEAFANAVKGRVPANP